VSGVYNVLSEDELEITELPIGKWTRDYKKSLPRRKKLRILENITKRIEFILY
jgi:hypothetical protein